MQAQQTAKQQPQQRPDLFEQSALAVIGSIPQWHVSIKARQDGAITEATIQGWRPSSRWLGNAAGEFYVLKYSAVQVSGWGAAAAVHGVWHWPVLDKQTAALPSQSEAVREAFLRRALTATAFDVTSDEEASLRARAGAQWGVEAPALHDAA